MKYQHLLAFCSALVLAGCATTVGPEAAPAAVPQSAADQPGVTAVARPAPPQVIPSGPLSVINPSQVSSRSVTALVAPTDLWARIRRGFAMPNLETDLVRKQEQWYATRPDVVTEGMRRYAGRLPVLGLA